MVKVYRFDDFRCMYRQIYGADIDLEPAFKPIMQFFDSNPPGFPEGGLVERDIIDFGNYQVMYHEHHQALISQYGKGYLDKIYDWEERFDEYVEDNTYTTSSGLQLGDEMITVVIVEPEKAAYRAEILSEIDTMDQICDGDFDGINLSDGVSCFYNNDEETLQNQRPNRILPLNESDLRLIYGNMVFFHSDNGHWSSLAEDEVQKYLAMYSEPYKIQFDSKTGTLTLY